jgi:hypothetical protein
MPMPMPLPLQVSSHHYSNIMTITSLLGIANNNKRQEVQPTLDSSFFGGGTLKIAEAFNAEHGIRGCKCAHCGDWKTSQGITNHLAWHVRNGHTKNPSRANPQGRVVARVPCREKIEAMQQWQDSPFRIIHIVTDTSAGGGSYLKRIAQKANCLACKIGRGNNKTCVQE